jgi:hypothetical protein
MSQLNLAVEINNAQGIWPLMVEHWVFGIDVDRQTHKVLILDGDSLAPFTPNNLSKFDWDRQVHVLWKSD